MGPAIRIADSDPSVAGWSLRRLGCPAVLSAASAPTPSRCCRATTATAAGARPGPSPGRPGQIALGERTLAAIHSRVGATIGVSLDGARPHRYRIVGAAVFPTLSDVLGLGQGAALTVPGLYRLLPAGVQAPPPFTLLVRFRGR